MTRTNLTIDADRLWDAHMRMAGIGATPVCLRAVRADVIWHLFDTEAVTHLYGAPTVLVTIADAPQAHRLERQPNCLD